MGGGRGGSSARDTAARWVLGENWEEGAGDNFDPTGRLGGLFGYGPLEEEGAGLPAVGPPRIETTEYAPPSRPSGAGLGGRPDPSGAFASIMAKRGQPTGLGG